jgi:hypothetical protein
MEGILYLANQVQKIMCGTAGLHLRSHFFNSSSLIKLTQLTHTTTIMTASPVRIPFSTHNRRRRLRVMDECLSLTCQVQKSKQQQPQDSMLSDHNHSAAVDPSESINSTESSSSSSQSMWRTRDPAVHLDVDNSITSLWTLKRASPVCDSSEDEDDVDDEELFAAYSYSSPSKRRSRVVMLEWKDSVDFMEQEAGRYNNRFLFE